MTTPEPNAVIQTPPTARARSSARVLMAPAVLAASLAALAGGVYYAIATRPKVDVGSLLEEAGTLIGKGDFSGALEQLNTKVVPVVNAGMGTDKEIAEFFTLRARSLYEAAAGQGVRREENFRSVLADYTSARRHGAALEPADVVRLAASRLELGQVDEALKDADSLPASEAEAKKKLTKSAVMRGLENPKKYFDRTLGLLVELAQEPGISSDEAAWALARQGELLIGAGRQNEAITKMLREMQLIRGLTPRQEAELSELLGRAYFDEGELAEAGRQLERAVSLSEPASELRAMAQVELGQIRQATGQLDEARDLFSSALEHVNGTPAYLSALMGRASVAAAQGNDDAALRDFAELIEKLPKEKSSGRLSPESIADGLMAQNADRTSAGKTRAALRYAVLAESLFAPARTPTNILLALAAANRRLGDELMGRAVDASRATEAAGEKPIEEVDAVTREEAKRCYLAAGSYYARHADAVVVEDADSASRSRWISADSYDLAGDTDEAIKAFSAYLQGAPGQDSRRQEAKYRLARVFQSVGDYATAASLFRDLLEEREKAPDRGGMVWADRSIVPLAECYLADKDPGNDTEAERQLLSVLDGRDFSPQAEEFRAALLELGKAYYESGKYSQAIERLQEFATRFPVDAEIEGVRFRLADSERLSAAEIDKSLEQPMPQAQREELEKTRQRRLREALAMFDQVKQALSTRKAESLGPVDKVHLRNSTFYLGDCAYELGDYETAIGYYDAARQQYDADPASLVALVQIVNAYVHEGQWAKAMTANERARQHLAKFPESVWADPDLPMDKRHWERWLDSRSLLEQHARANEGQ